VSQPTVTKQVASLHEGGRFSRRFEENSGPGGGSGRTPQEGSGLAGRLAQILGVMGSTPFAVWVVASGLECGRSPRTGCFKLTTPTAPGTLNRPDSSGWRAGS